MALSNYLNTTSSFPVIGTTAVLDYSFFNSTILPEVVQKFFKLPAAPPHPIGTHHAAKNTSINCCQYKDCESLVVKSASWRDMKLRTREKKTPTENRTDPLRNVDVTDMMNC